MAITVHKYNKFLRNQLNGVAPIDFDTDTIKAMIVTSAYTPDPVNDVYIAAVDTNEVTGTGYSPGGVTLTGTTLTESAGVSTFDANDISIGYNAAGFDTGHYIVFYKDTGTPATSPLICYYNLGTDSGNLNFDFEILFNAAGIATWA